MTSQLAAAKQQLRNVMKQKLSAITNDSVATQSTRIKAPVGHLR